jgi:hypothetical protein
LTNDENGGIIEGQNNFTKEEIDEQERNYSKGCRKCKG